MPVRRIPVSFPAMEEAIAELEKTDRIISVAPDGGGALYVVTEPKRAKRGQDETR